MTSTVVGESVVASYGIISMSFSGMPSRMLIVIASPVQEQAFVGADVEAAPPGGGEDGRLGADIAFRPP